MFNPENQPNTPPQEKENLQQKKPEGIETKSQRDIKFSGEVSRYYNDRIEKEADLEDTSHESFLRANQQSLDKLADPKLAEAIQPRDVSVALSEMSGVMSSNNPHEIRTGDEITDKENERRYLATRKLFLESCKKIFPDKKSDSSKFILTINRLRKSAGNFDVVPEIKNPFALLREDPKKLAKEIDNVLFQAGHTARELAEEAFNSTKSEDFDTRSRQLHQAIEAIYELELLKDELTQKIYGRVDITPSETMKIDEIKSELEDKKNNPEQERIKKLREKAGHNISILQQGLAIGLASRFQEIGFRLSENDPRLEILASGLELIRKEYQNDTRTRDKKNPDFIKKIDDLFLSLKQ